MRLITKTWRQVFLGYCGAWTIGLFFGLIVLLLRLLGRLKIKGEKKLLTTAKEGRVVIMSNHPSLVEAFLLPVILSPRHLFDLRSFFWSMPDGKLFSVKDALLSKLKRNLFRLGRCVSISRLEGHNYSPLKQLLKILKAGENVVIHPEAGRTMKGLSFVSLKTRRLRRVEGSAVMLAARLEGTILPVFVDKEEELSSVTASIGSLFASKQPPMIVWVGDPYKPDASKGLEELNRELEQKILKAGLS